MHPITMSPTCLQACRSEVKNGGQCVSSSYSHTSLISAIPWLCAPPLRFYRNIFNLELWAPCLTNASTLNATQPVPAGWTVLKTITLEEPSLTLPTPFVTVLGQGSSLAIIIRGTGTGDEWMYGEWVLY